MVRLLKKLIRLLPPTATSWIYVRLCRVWPLKQIANSIIRSAIPEKIPIKEGVLILNRSDMAVSGQLALGVFENIETDLFWSALKKGMNVADIGANIGYYTVIAAHRVGPQGHVFAYEPEPENHKKLLLNIEANRLGNVTPLTAALAEKSGTHRLYLTEDNKGTHSLADNRGTGKSIGVRTETLDASLAKVGSPKIDVIKIDIEGAEALAFDGMAGTISQNPGITLFLELHPRAVARFGRSPKELLDKLSALGFSFTLIDEDKKRTVPLPPEMFGSFIASFPKNRDAGKTLYASRNAI